MLRRGSTGPDGELADLFMAMQSAGRTSAPVPSHALASVLLGATPVDLLTPEDLARSPRPAQPGRRARLAGRLAALAPATKLLLAGSVAVAAVTVSVAVNELSEDRLRVDVVTPATPTSHATSPDSLSSDSPSSDSSSPTPSSQSTTSRSATQQSTMTQPDRSQPGRSASSTRSSEGFATSTRSEDQSGTPSPRGTSRDASPTSSSTSETETTDPSSEQSSPEATTRSGREGSVSSGELRAETSSTVAAE